MVYARVGPLLTPGYTPPPTSTAVTTGHPRATTGYPRCVTFLRFRYILLIQNQQPRMLPFCHSCL